MSRKTRRAFLGTAGAVAFGGCLSSFRSSGTDGAPGETGTPTQIPSETAPTTPSQTNSGTDTDTDTPTPTGTPSDLAGLPGEQRDGFESFDRWFVLSGQGELTAESDDPYAGSQSAHVTSESGDSYGAIFKSYSGPQDFTGKNLSLAVKLEKPEIAKISVDLLAPDRGNIVRMMRTLPGPTGTWVRVDFGTTEVRREPDLSQVQEVRIICRRRDGVDEPVEFSVDDFRAVERPSKGRVMLTFDDIHDSHYQTAFPVMQEYGMSGVEGVIAEAVGNGDRLDVGEMRQMRDDGWDMASHPLTRGTPMPEFSRANQEQRIRENQEFLGRNGFRKGARHFLTPQNRVGPNTRELVRKYHDTLFTFGGMPNGLAPTTTYNFGRINSGNLDLVKRYVDYAERYGQMVVINHHVLGSGGLSESQFRSQVEYIDGADVEVVTASDLVDG